MTLVRHPSALVLALVAFGLPVLAASTSFSHFTPLTSSAAPLVVDSSDEATPITLSSPHFSQRTIADRRTQNTLVPGSNSGNWDMIAPNETGRDRGRYLFMPFETGTAGVMRVDTNDPNYNTRTVTIVAPGTEGFVAGDASRWAPWGGYLTGEESWGAGSVKGRLFEITNPLTAGPSGGNVEQRIVIPRVSHEGLAFDRERTLYFVDELNGGSVYKYVSAKPRAKKGDVYFAEGQTFVLRVGAGGQFEGNNGPAITGLATWVPITNEAGGPIPGVSTVLPDGTIDGRVTADHASIMGTGFNRPEDLEIQTLPGRGRHGDDDHRHGDDDRRHGDNDDDDDATQLLYFATTDSDLNGSTTDGRSRVYTMNLRTNEVRLFASAEFTDLATGLPAGGGFRNADNIARPDRGGKPPL